MKGYGRNKTEVHVINRAPGCHRHMDGKTGLRPYADLVKRIICVQVLIQFIIIGAIGDA